MIRDVISDALQFAARKHTGQMRKTDPDIPYISHPAAVGSILQEAGYAKDVVVAGILHDTLEDTETAPEEIVNSFGARVEEIVRTVSEDKSLPWEQRKAAYLQSVVEGSDEAKAVSTADKINNIYGILSHLSRGDQDVWKVFTQNPEKVTATYRTFVDAMSSAWKSPLLKTLEDAVVELERTLENG